MPPKASTGVSWPHYVSALALLVSLVAAALRVLLLDWSDPYHCNSLLHRGQWLDTMFQNWQPDGCMLYKYAPTSVSKCLHSKRIVFIGDSIARQLFYSMAHLADPTLPSSLPSSFEKHSDQSFPVGKDGARFDFFWDPFLNSTKVTILLEGGRYGGKEKPALLVIGSGLWFLRYEGSGGIASWEGTIERILDSVAGAMPALADEVVILPVQQPVVEKLSPERKESINHADIDAMNSDLIHRLSPTSTHFNDRPRLPYQSRSLPILFPSVFNQMLHPSQTEDGLHYSEHIMTYQAQVLLNLRCNDVLPKKYPFNHTCCARYTMPNIIQGLLLILVMLYGPIVYLLRRQGLDKQRWAGMLTPREEYALPITIFGGTIGLCYLADRTGLWVKEQKQFHPISFAGLCTTALFGGLVTFRSGSKDLGFLNREQTDEWKGWMQIVILIYHYLGASKVSGIYAPIRVLVASYLFMTGYGHTSYYLKKADFSFERVARVLVRLNLLTIFLAYAMNTSYLFYYFAPLVSFWYLVVYFTLFIYHKYNERTPLLIVKIATSAILVALLHSKIGLVEKMFELLRMFAKVDWEAKEWSFRVNLDILVVYMGMLTSVGYMKFSERRIVDHPRWSWIHRSILVVCGLGIVWFFLFEISKKDKFAYNTWHPLVGVVPVMAYVGLRNASSVMRGASSQLFILVGRCSLELFILQYHIWLAGDTKGILILLPGVKYRPLNLLISSTVFIWISHHVALATGELTKFVCDTPQNQGIPTAISTPLAPVETSRIDSIHAAPGDVRDEESIPLAYTASNMEANQTVLYSGQISTKETDGAVLSAPPARNVTDSSPSIVSVESVEDYSTSRHRNPPPFPITNWGGATFALPVRMGVIVFGVWMLNLIWPL